MENTNKQLSVSELIRSCAKNASKQFMSLGVSDDTTPELAFRLYTDLLNAQIQHELMTIQMKGVQDGRC